MPQALPAFLVGAGMSVATAVAVSAVVVGLVKVAAYSVLQRLLTKRPGAGAAPINVTVRSTVTARRLIFGTVRAGGSVLFVRTSGTNNKYLWIVVAYAGHQCSDVRDLWLDKFKVPDADINAGTGAVSTALLDGKLSCWTYLGTQAQTADSNLDAEFTEWTTNHRLRGICYRVLKLEASTKAWPSGAPQNFTSLVDGALVYDPRLDSTNGGAGSHRRDNPSTWAFNRNLALNVRHFLSGGSVVNDQATRLTRYGVKETDSRIDDAYIITAANVCDQSVSGANAPPSGAQPRYTCDYEASCDQTRRDILEDMLAGGGPAQLISLHGKWRLYVAAYDAPSHTFSQDDIFGGEMQVDDTTGDQERFNQISAVYLDAEREYFEATTPVRSNAAYVTQDGANEIPKETSLRCVTDQYRAQRIIELMLRKARQMRRIRVPFGRQGLKVAPWETISFSHARYGWVSVVYRCIEREVDFTEDGGMFVWLTLVADPSSIYVDLATGDYTTGTSATSAIQQHSPEAPTGLTATPLVRAIEFNWSMGAFWEQNGIAEIWEYPSQTPFASATRIWFGRGTRAVIQRSDSVLKYFWVRLSTIGGQMSSTDPATNGLPARALKDPQIIADPNFDWAVDQSYWQFTNSIFGSGTPSGITLSASGGVSAGYLQLVGDSTAKYAFNKRSEDFAVITGQSGKIRFRWMRTGSISSALGTDNIIFLGAFTHTGGIPVAAGFSSSGSTGIDRATINAVNANEWQETELTFTITNAVKSSTQFPYLAIMIGMNADCTGGTIRIDSVEAHLV